MIAMADKSLAGPGGTPGRPNVVLRYTHAFWAMGRPMFLCGTVPLYLLGAAAAYRDSYTIRASLLVAGLVFMWLVQLTTHYSNEYRDFRTDLATAVPTRMSGGSRVLIRGMVKPAAARWASLVSLFLAITGMSVQPYTKQVIPFAFVIR